MVMLYVARNCCNHVANQVVITIDIVYTNSSKFVKTFMVYTSHCHKGTKQDARSFTSSRHEARS